MWKQKITRSTFESYNLEHADVFLFLTHWTFNQQKGRVITVRISDRPFPKSQNSQKKAISNNLENWWLKVNFILIKCEAQGLSLRHIIAPKTLQGLRSKNLSCWSLSNSKLKIEVKINSINYVRVLKSYQIIPNDKKDIGAILFISWIMTKIHSRQSFKGQLIFTPLTSWPLLRDFIAWKLISNQFACVFRAYAIWLYYRILA